MLLAEQALWKCEIFPPWDEARTDEIYNCGIFVESRYDSLLFQTPVLAIVSLFHLRIVVTTTWILFLYQ